MCKPSHLVTQEHLPDLHALVGLVQPRLIRLSSSPGERSVPGGIIDSTVHGERRAQPHQQRNRESSPQHIVLQNNEDRANETVNPQLACSAMLSNLVKDCLEISHAGYIMFLRAKDRTQDLFHKHPQCSHIVRKLLATEHLWTPANIAPSTAFSPLPFNSVIEAETKLMSKCIPPSRRKTLETGLGHPIGRAEPHDSVVGQVLILHIPFSIPVSMVDPS